MGRIGEHRNDTWESTRQAGLTTGGPLGHQSRAAITEHQERLWDFAGGLGVNQGSTTESGWKCCLCQGGRFNGRGEAEHQLQCLKCSRTCHLWCCHPRGSVEAEEADRAAGWACGSCSTEVWSEGWFSGWQPITSTFRWFVGNPVPGDSQHEGDLPRKVKCVWCAAWSSRADCECGWRKTFRLQHGLTFDMFPDKIGVQRTPAYCQCGRWRPGLLWTHHAAVAAQALLHQRARGKAVGIEWKFVSHNFERVPTRCDLQEQLALLDTNRKLESSGLAEQLRKSKYAQAFFTGVVFTLPTSLDNIQGATTGGLSSSASSGDAQRYGFQALMEHLGEAQLTNDCTLQVRAGEEQYGFFAPVPVVHNELIIEFVTAILSTRLCPCDPRELSDHNTQRGTDTGDRSSGGVYRRLSFANDACSEHVDSAEVDGHRGEHEMGLRIGDRVMTEDGFVAQISASSTTATETLFDIDMGGMGIRLGVTDSALTPVSPKRFPKTSHRKVCVAQESREADEWTCMLCNKNRADALGLRSTVWKCSQCSFSCHATCYHEKHSPEFEEVQLRHEQGHNHSAGPWRCRDCDVTEPGITTLFRWYFPGYHVDGPLGLQTSQWTGYTPEADRFYPSKCARCGDMAPKAICPCGWRKTFRLYRHLRPSNFLTFNIGTTSKPDLCACGGWVPLHLWTQQATTCAVQVLQGRTSETPTHLIVELVLAFTASGHYRHRQVVDERDHHGRALETGTFASPLFHKPFGLTNLGNSCFVAAAVQLLARAGDLQIALQDAESRLGRVLHQTFMWLRSGPARSSKQVMTSLLDNLHQLGFLQLGKTGDAMEITVRILQFLHAAEPEPLKSTLRALFCNDTLVRFDCRQCGHRWHVQEECWFRGIPVAEDAAYEELEEVLNRSPDERLTLRCRWCPSETVLAQRIPLLRKSSRYLLIHFVSDSPNSLHGRRRGGVLRPILSTAAPQPVVTLANAAYTQTWELLGTVAHKHGHYVAHVKGFGRAWITADDTHVRLMEDLPPRDLLADGYVFMYGRGPRMRDHARCLEQQIPCTDCDVPGCSNGLALSSVEAKASPWLLGQQGLYAARDIQKGEFIASFGTLLHSGRAGSNTIEVTGPRGKTYLCWKRADTHCLGQVANATCCKVHKNATIVYNGKLGQQARVWLQASHDVKYGVEILVSYGSQFFQGMHCVCCACDGSCSGRDPGRRGGESPPPPLSP